MNKLAVVKLVASTIVGSGTTSISSQIIQNNTNPTTVIAKITNGAGAVVIGMIAAERTREYTGTKIDEIVAAWNAVQSKDAS
jgi:hypothetical protein